MVQPLVVENILFFFNFGSLLLKVEFAGAITFAALGSDNLIHILFLSIFLVELVSEYFDSYLPHLSSEFERPTTSIVNWSEIISVIPVFPLYAWITLEFP